MPLTNLNNDHFTQEEMEKMNNIWKEFMACLLPKSCNLSPTERKKFGSVAEQNKLVIQKTLDYHTNQPHLDSPEVNYSEVVLDWADRTFAAGFISKFAEATNIFNNIRITHDFDAFKASTTDYRYTKYKMGTDPGAGWESKYEELLPFFKSHFGKKAADKEVKDIE